MLVVAKQPRGIIIADAVSSATVKNHAGMGVLEQAAQTLEFASPPGTVQAILLSTRAHFTKMKVAALGTRHVNVLVPFFANDNVSAAGTNGGASQNAASVLAHFAVKVSMS